MGGCCGESAPIIPNVIGGGCVDIDKTDPENWVISAPCPPEVISSDDSVIINVEEDSGSGATIYDLSVACCDSKVGACPNDTNPGSLIEKLFVDGPLVLDLDNCPGDASVTLSIDIEALDDLLSDQYVKVRADGDEHYLEDLLTVNGGGSGPLKDTISDNNYDVSIDEDDDHWKRPCGRRTIDTSVVVSGLARDSNGTAPLTGFTDSSSNDAGQLAVADAVKITKAGWYRFSIRGLIEVNDAFNAIRFIGVSTNVSNTGLLDWKNGAGNASGGIDSTSSDGKILYDGNPFLTVSATENIECILGEEITIWYKWNTEQTVNSNTGKFRVVGNTGSPYVVATGKGFTISWEYIDDVF